MILLSRKERALYLTLLSSHKPSVSFDNDEVHIGFSYPFIQLSCFCNTWQLEVSITYIMQVGSFYFGHAVPYYSDGMIISLIHREIGDLISISFLIFKFHPY